MTHHSPLHSLRALCGIGLLLGMTSLPMLAQADDNSATPSSDQQVAEPVIANGDETRAWLKLQDTGTQASRHKQIMGGKTMGIIYDRYLDSFKKPIHPASNASSQTSTK